MVGTVVPGRIRFEIEGHDAILLHAGDPFFEPRNSHVLHFDYAADNEPAVFLACYLLAPDTRELITMDPASS